MNSLLPITGSNALLEQLSPFIPDGFLCEQWPHRTTGGRQGQFSAAQLWRLHLLVLLTRLTRSTCCFILEMLKAVGPVADCHPDGMAWSIQPRMSKLHRTAQRREKFWAARFAGCGVPARKLSTNGFAPLLRLPKKILQKPE
jgi:hypothetical protein